MRAGRNILLISLGLALAVWVGDAVVESSQFHADASILDMLLLNIPAHDLYGRLLATLPIPLFGALVAWLVSRQKDSEDRCRESERHFRGVLENLHAVAVILDHEGRIVFCNDYLLELTGRSRSEVIDGDWFSLFLPEDVREPVGRMFRESIAEGEMPAHFENPICARNGERLLVKWNNSVLTGHDSQGARVACIGENVTAQRTAEKERALLSVAIDQSEEIVSVLDTEGRILYANAAFAAACGRPRESIAGEGLDVLEDPDNEQSSVALLRERIAEDRAWTGRIAVKAGEGSYRELDVTVSPVRDEQGRVVNHVLVGRDISKQLALEEQLRQAQKMEAVGRLTGGIAHDFNNLLTVINGYAELLQMDMAYDSPRLRDVNEIAKASSKASELTKRLLAFSRKAVLRPQVLNINDVLRDLGRLLMRLIGENINLRVHADPALWNVKADAGQIEQVVFNLVANARDAMPDGGALSVETRNLTFEGGGSPAEREIADGRYVQMTVRDNGHGMDDATVARIFDPFFSTKGEEGTGLGLSTVYGIVRQHEGHILCESAPGEGTTFSIYLPAVDEPVRSGERVHGGGTKTRTPQTILLVEDEEDVLAVAAQILERKRYFVLKAATGEEALALAEDFEGPIHLLITDLILPDTNGRTVADVVTRIRPGVRVLYISGYEERTVAQHGVLGADAAFLQKPFRVMDLQQKVFDLLGDLSVEEEESRLRSRR